MCHSHRALLEKKKKTMLLLSLMAIHSVISSYEVPEAFIRSRFSCFHFRSLCIAANEEVCFKKRAKDVPLLELEHRLTDIRCHLTQLYKHLKQTGTIVLLFWHNGQWDLEQKLLHGHWRNLRWRIVQNYSTETVLSVCKTLFLFCLCPSVTKKPQNCLVWRQIFKTNSPDDEMQWKDNS